MNYQARPGAEKLDLLWKNIAATAYPPNGLPPGEPGLLARLPLFTIGYLRTSVEHESDELPPGRAKLLHRYGSVARVRFEATTEQPYTGLLRGSHEGLLRISAATAAPSFTPALALKLFVDGCPSANIMAMNKNDGEGKNHDVFAISYSNAVQPATRLPGTLLVRAFERGEKHAEPFANAATIASGIRVPAAVGDFMILDAIRQSHGTAIAVEEDRIREWMRLAVSSEGIAVCPEAAACVGALEQLIATGWIKPHEQVVLFNTGAVQKYPEAIAATLPRVDIKQPIDWDAIAA